MKGLNVKKLAAVATGAALLGMAIAPIVSAATNVTKEDVYSANGSPKVNIVIGSGAALSDAKAAANLGVKIAEKAATSKTVSASATGENGEAGTADLDLSDLTVDVTVGGSVSFGAGSKKYQQNLNSGSAASNYEVIAALDGTNDANALTDAQLPHLYNGTIVQKVNNGDQSNQKNSLTVQEKIGISVDAKFDTTSDIKDLVAKIQSGEFSYMTTIGSSTTGVDLGSTSFTDGSDDDVKVMFFGQEYELSSATLSGTKYVKLVKASARESFNEGETIEGLVGNHEFDGKEVSVKVVQIVQAGTAVSTYSATFELYDAEGNLVDTRTVTTAQNLKDVFKDSDQEEALKSNLYVDTIAVGSTTGVGYVEVTKGTDTVELYDGSIYPYDSSHTGSKPYVARIVAGTSDANSLYSIEIENSAEIWTDPDATTFDKGPLYPTRTGQSLQGKEGASAVFLQSLDDGTQGKGYAKVEFLGFEGDEEKTVVQIGKTVDNLPSGSTGGLSFKDDSSAQRNVPFYLKVNDNNAASIEFEDKAISFNYDFGSGGKTGTADVNVLVTNGNTVNGRIWTITCLSNGASDASTTDGNVQINVQGVGLLTVGPQGADANVAQGSAFTIDGVTYTLRDSNVTAGSHIVGVNVDTAVDIRYGNSDGTTYVYNQYTGSTCATYSCVGPAGKLLLSNSATFDGNSVSATPVTVGMHSGDTNRRIYYAAQYNGNDLWLLLDADRLIGGSGSDKIQNSHAVRFMGTVVPDNDGTYTEVKGIGDDFVQGNSKGPSAVSGTASKIIYPGQVVKQGTAWWYSHYVPQTTDFNTATLFGASNAFFIAEFQVDDAVSTGDFNVYIDTREGALPGPFTQSNLAGYSTDADYNATGATFSIQSGTQSTYLKGGYTDAGTKAMLVNDSDSDIKISMPQSAEKVDIVVYGTEVAREVSGGDPITGLKVGEEGTTDSGTKVTVTAVNGGSCKVSGADGGSVLCTATPSSYMEQAAVKNPLVFLDVEAPTGPNIIVGGHIVNSLASSLADRLTEPGQVVAEVDAATGDIYLAGYTANDTEQAVQDLIDEIEGW